MRFDADAPPGMMDFVFVMLMLWGKAEGYHSFNCGMTPLADLENGLLAPLWDRLGATIYQHGEHFDNVQGLREYKEQFNPLWQARFLATPPGTKLPLILADVASLCRQRSRVLSTRASLGNSGYHSSSPVGAQVPRAETHASATDPSERRRLEGSSPRNLHRPRGL